MCHCQEHEGRGVLYAVVDAYVLLRIVPVERLQGRRVDEHGAFVECGVHKSVRKHPFAQDEAPVEDTRVLLPDVLDVCPGQERVVLEQELPDFAVQFVRPVHVVGLEPVAWVVGVRGGVQERTGRPQTRKEHLEEALRDERGFVHVGSVQRHAPYLVLGLLVVRTLQVNQMPEEPARLAGHREGEVVLAEVRLHGVEAVSLERGLRLAHHQEGAVHWGHGHDPAPFAKRCEGLAGRDRAFEDVYASVPRMEELRLPRSQFLHRPFP